MKIRWTVEDSTDNYYRRTTSWVELEIEDGTSDKDIEEIVQEDFNKKVWLTWERIDDE